MSLSVEAMKQQPIDDGQVAYQAAESVVGRGPKLVMEPAIEELHRTMVLEQAADTASQIGLHRTPVAGRRRVVSGRW